jgi:hypothetical protein
MSLGYAKGQQIENGLRNSYLNVMNLESNGPTGFFRAIGFFLADPKMESSLKPD